MTASHQLMALLAAAVATLGTVPHAHAAASAVEEYVRAGNAPAALEALRQEPQALPAEEAAYWQGRALIMLNRPEDAAEAFYRVPKQHPLYPYAARGIIYCAWCSPRMNFIEVVGPLAAGPDDEVAALALAALAEYQLRYTDDADLTIYNRLKEKARQDATLMPIVQLLELHLYRRQGDYTGGIEQARKLEQDTALSAIMRQRVRLALAELYYAKEKAHEAAEDKVDAEESDEGKGEETLLQFITANPESPLLEEAFRRLNMHSGANGSEYARSKLQDWTEDTAHSKRAALAFYTLQQMNLLHGAEVSGLVNKAASELPGEPLTLTILQNHIRKLFAQNQDESAGLYLSLLVSLQKTADARTNFLQALAYKDNDPLRAMQLFKLSATAADEELLPAAMTNALICAMRSGDTQSAEQLLQATTNRRTKRSMLLAHAGLLLEQDPRRALLEVSQAGELYPTFEQQNDIHLDTLQLTLAQDAKQTLDDLLAISPQERSKWTEQQKLRYAALIEKAADDAQPMSPPTAPATEALLQKLYAEAESLSLKEGVALRLAERLSAAKKHRQALALLLDLAKQQQPGARKAATLFFAGHESARLGTLDDLEGAVALYAECAKQSSDLRVTAAIEQAATLVRINRSKEAMELLRPLLQQQATLKPDEQAHLLTVQADAYGMDMTPASLHKALELSMKISDIPHVSASWRARGRLQHAALCTREARYEEALADYTQVMQDELTTADADDARSCFLMYYAAAGAVYQLIQLGRYEEAANMADVAGAWPGTIKSPSTKVGPKSEAFKRWAQSIRQTHFLPIPVLDQEHTLS